ncbi:hypothetical protein KY329_04635 [Candidatus Woesearchaeota archaeon]|nr:hypothetical protein [Candidatus Woesearchaeota archaeon]
MARTKRRGRGLFWILILLLIGAGIWYYNQTDVTPGLAVARPKAPVLVAIDDTSNAMGVVAATNAVQQFELILGKGSAETRLFSEVAPKDLTKWKTAMLINSPGTVTTPEVRVYTSIYDKAPAQYVKATTAAINAIKPTYSQTKLHSEMDLHSIGQLW